MRAQGMRYAMSRRKVLECFLIEGRVVIDSNIVEPAIRPEMITSKACCSRAATGGGQPSPPYC